MNREVFVMDLTEKQAYKAMFHYLKEFSDRIQSDQLGVFLEKMKYREDGTPLDAAILQNWEDAVKQAKNQDFFK